MQTHIYFVETRAREQRSILCRWAEHFYEAGYRVQVLVDSTMAAQQLDEMLWTFSQDSFVPHRIAPSSAATRIVEPVVIVVGQHVLPDFDLLICDGHADLELMAQFPFVLHFVIVDDPQLRQHSRLIYQAARDRGLQLEHMAQIAGARLPRIPPARAAAAH